MMNIAVEQLFERLNNAGETPHNHTVAELETLLEKSHYPGRNKEARAWVLPDDLLEVSLPAQEIRAVVNRTIKLAESKDLPRKTRMALIPVTALNAEIDDAEVLLQLFSEFSQTFTEQGAFRFIASVANFFLRIENTRYIHPVIVKSETVKLPETFQKSSGKRLLESATRVLNCLKENGIDSD